MLVKDLLKSKKRDVITATPSMTITRAMDLLITNQISCLPVIGDVGELAGIVSDRDIFRAVHKDGRGFSKLCVGDLMTTQLMVGVPDDDIKYIGGVMTQNRIRHVPIVENDNLVGLISVGDVVKAQMDTIEVENRYLKTYITGRDQG
jgi:CBS domain-containing protein